MTTTKDWLDSAILLRAQDRLDDALDLVYARLDDWGYNGDHLLIDIALQDPRMVTLDTDLLLGVITVTRRWRHRLPSRAALCQTARALFTQRGEDADDLLRNLDIP